jgi:hypothetical protein
MQSPPATIGFTLGETADVGDLPLGINDTVVRQAKSLPHNGKAAAVRQAEPHTRENNKSCDVRPAEQRNLQSCDGRQAEHHNLQKKGR